MSVLHSRQLSITRITFVAVTAAYFLVTAGVDLFHDESCEKRKLGEESTNALIHNGPCPACAFKANCNSTGPMFQPVLVAPRVPVVCWLEPYNALATRAQWMHSIVLRAPPTS